MVSVRQMTFQYDVSKNRYKDVFVDFCIRHHAICYGGPHNVIRPVNDEKNKNMWIKKFFF
jgi:hypothetical protein